MTWPPRSPDLTSYDFFLWGYVREKAFVPPLSLNTDELKLKIATVMEKIERNLSERVWNELDYRLDICRITNGARIEHLQGM
jgi:hypothetical protein